MSAPPPGTPGNTWTDERVATLRELRLEGLSCSQIAKRLGGVSRNAVIGKLARLGLSNREGPAVPRFSADAKLGTRPHLKPGPALKTSKSVFTAPNLTGAPHVDKPEAPGSASILSLRTGQCGWPIGDPQDVTFTLCGAPADGRYCKAHAAIARAPVQAKPHKSLAGWIDKLEGRWSSRPRARAIADGWG